MAWRQAIIWTNYGYFTDAYMRLSTSIMGKVGLSMLAWSSYLPVYRPISNKRRTLVCNKIVDHSDIVGASPVSAVPTTSSFST